VQVKDRSLVQRRMMAHVHHPQATPLLVFPEGTCVNNEYTVMFKRGAFDLGATVCPVAIKYNKIFFDAFWNSRRQAFTTYIVRVHKCHIAMDVAPGGASDFTPNNVPKLLPGRAPYSFTFCSRCPERL
jgi:1-acyl-sn-glycerol-3-phosphate acyltransferase